MEDILLKCQGRLTKWFLQECRLYQAFLVLLQIIQIALTNWVKINNYNLSIIKCFLKAIQGFLECLLLSQAQYQGLRFQLVHQVDLRLKTVHRTCTIKRLCSLKCNSNIMLQPSSNNTFTCTISNINSLSSKPHTIKEIKAPMKS